MIQKKILLLFFILLCVETNAQTPSYFTIGAEEFANADVYSLLYDDASDILYAATNRGLFSYRQNKFSIIKPKDSQPVYSLFQLKKNSKGQIFCSNLRGQVYEVAEDGLSLFYEMPKGATVKSFRYYFDSRDNLIVNTFEEIRKVSTNGVETVLLNKNNPVPFELDTTSLSVFYSSQLVNGDIYFVAYRQSEYFVYKDGALTNSQLPNSEINTKVGFIQLGNVLYFHSGTSLKRVDGKKVKSNILIENGSEITLIDSNSIAVRSYSKGVRIISLQNDSLIEVSVGIKNSFLSTTTINQAGTVFLGTFKDGIYVIPNLEIEKYKVDYPFSGITTSINNDVYVSNRKGQIFKHYNGYKVYGEGYNYNISNLFHLKGTYYSDGVKVDSIIHKPTHEKFMGVNFDNLKDLEEYKDEFVLFMSANAIFIMLKDSSNFQVGSFANLIHDNLYALAINGRGKSITYIPEKESFYYATNQGVYEQKWNEVKPRNLLINGANISANDLVVYKGELVIGTERDGVLLFKSGDYSANIELSNGLKSNTVLKLEIHEDLLFLLTLNGIQVYDLARKQFIYIGESDGVLSNAVIDFALSKDKLWLLDKQGYYAFDLNSFKKIKEVELGAVFLDSMTVNNVSVLDDVDKKFSHDKKEIQFFFDYRDIESKAETEIKYKLLGASDEWITIETSTNVISYPSLSEGKYTFVLKAIYRGQETNEIRVDFEISPPFWFQLWFAIVSITSIIALVSILFLLQMKKNKRRRAIESKTQKMQIDIFESKLKALRSQMNPHFIFNSLNSIQALVLKKDIEKSYDYIEMFSNLVRKTLVFSEKNYIPISEETKFLSIYLDLESLRMKEEFSFKIENNSEEEILIPSLLIQPFLENAIHHGLLHKKGKKDLFISFNCEKEAASCTIIDNGIGRDKANEINQRQKYRHESFSLASLNKRLEILSEQNNKTFGYIIEDLFTEEGVSSGTKVTVSFPFRNQY